MAHINYKSQKYNTLVLVHPDNWDEKKNRIRGISKTVKDDNLIIEKSMAQMNNILFGTGCKMPRSFRNCSKTNGKTRQGE